MNLNSFEEGEKISGKGRIKFVRKAKGIRFITLLCGPAELDIIQLSFFDKQFKKFIDTQLGSHDRIKFVGKKYISPRGHASVKIDSFEIIVRCLRRQEIGKKKITITDRHIMDANRTYFAFVSDNARKRIKLRCEVDAFITQFFLENNYFMATTPILSTTYGGANAKPFHSKLNEGGRAVAMRIAPELNLKRMITMGFDKVFELGKQFRNEGLDKTHHPEFTTCEFYESGGDMRSMIDITSKFLYAFSERFIDEIGFELENVGEADYLNLISRGLEKLNINVSRDDLRDFDIQRDICKKLEIDTIKEKMLDKLFDEVVEIGDTPLFVVNIPNFMSPLAKTSSDEYFAERFELYMNGMELANGYSELSNPAEQLRKFKLQSKSKDDEKMCVDKAYVADLKLGMPPTGGCGFGVERLMMTFFGIENILDTISFPSFSSEQT